MYIDNNKLWPTAKEEELKNAGPTKVGIRRPKEKRQVQESSSEKMETREGTDASRVGENGQTCET